MKNKHSILKWNKFSNWYSTHPDMIYGSQIPMSLHMAGIQLQGFPVVLE